MAAQIFGPELEELKKYLRSDLNEDSKRQLLFPLFRKLFKDSFRAESAAFNADIYIPGQLIVECKTSYSDWTKGFYQAFHYNKRFGLAFNTVMVIAKEFVGIWRTNKIPEFAAILINTADPFQLKKYKILELKFNVLPSDIRDRVIFIEELSHFNVKNN